ncbi:hypothetical protein PHMEG_00040434, partial [Phytophthora megakarya]
EEYTERDDLLSDVFELHEDAENVRDEKKRYKEAKVLEEERANVMRDEVGVEQKKSKYDSFTELMVHVKERDEFAGAVEMRKVASEESRLALECERLGLEKEERVAFLISAASLYNSTSLIGASSDTYSSRVGSLTFKSDQSSRFLKKIY